ncbi:MAG: hypothetical protein ACTSRC_19480 [Candidatus Helarchaeota archaeon]
MEYPWYTIIDKKEPPLQGDFIDSCPVFIPLDSLNLKQPEVEIVEYDVVVMSQSCDLEHKKLDIVLVCPVLSLTETGKFNNLYKTDKGKEGLRRGYYPSYHLLNKCELDGFKKDFLVVDFRNVFGIYYDFLLKLIKKFDRRLRLLSPYREHLSQAFARFFMRVGLPIDIPSFV